MSLRFKSLAVAALFSLSAPIALAQTDPFRELDDIEGSWINLNFQTVRPLALVSNGAGNNEELWALNTQDSTLVRFPTLISPQDLEIRVPWGPVAVAYWDASPFAVVPVDGESPPSAVSVFKQAPTPFNFPEQLLVVSKGSRALSYIDRATGQLLRMLELPDEPGDIVVNGKKAWIACSAEDVVVEVNLVTNTIDRTYTVPSKHPLFLTLEERPSGPDTILVTPMLSGNNSVPENLAGARRAGKAILDLDDPTVAAVGLPDEDLFRINPSTGTITPILRSAGTVLFGHGINPLTGDLWILNTEANNKDPENQTEPSINGFIASNRVALATLPSVGSLSAPGTPFAFIDLDDTNPAIPGVQFNRLQRAVGQPYSIDFASNGNAYITSLLSDVVVVHDAAGNYLSQINMPDNFIPRGIVVTEDDAGVVVWSGARAEARVYRTTPGHNLIRVHDLGYDPTPATVRRGRELFYDGSFSLNDNASCATCHVDGRNDLLTWNLSAGHSDDKGPMFTQTLVGIDKLLPYHWRGERADLIDFNGAFSGLLGGKTLGVGPGSDFEAFQAFVFSMQSSPNPFQDLSREISDDIQPPRLPAAVTSASAINGQGLFETTAVVGALVCTDCHTLPTGSNNDIFADDITGHLPRRSHFKVTPFNGAWRKGMPLVDIELIEDGITQPEEESPLLGAGVSHAGRVLDLLEFLIEATGSPQTQADITSFLHQLDQGIAPAVSRVFLLSPFTSGSVGPQLSGYLMPQAAENCDVIVYGTVQLNSVDTAMRWWWDRKAAVFKPEDSSVPTRTLNDFLANVADESNTFEAVPLGSGERHGVDFDNDGLYNGDELVLGTDSLNADTDGDGYPDGHETFNGGDATNVLAVPVDTTKPSISNLEVLWNTTKVARVRFDTDELTNWSISYSSNQPPFEVKTIKTSEFQRTHSLMLRDLIPSTPGDPAQTYTVTVSAFDPQGNFDTQSVQLTTLELIPLTNVDAVVGEVSLTGLRVTTNDVRVRARIRVDEKFGGPMNPPSANRAIIARVLVNGNVSQGFEPLGAGSFKATDFLTSGVNGFTEGYIPGPYLISLATDSNGFATLAFKLDKSLVNLNAEIRLNIEAVVRVNNAAAWLTELQGCSAANSCIPNLPTADTTRALTRWDMPDTLPENRGLTIDLGDLIEIDPVLPVLPIGPQTPTRL